MAYAPDDNIKQMRNQFFQGRRSEVSQNAQNTQQQGEDALQRRFASMGASGSGAQIAAMQKNRDAAADSQRKGLQDVNSQELQVGEGDAAKAFQSDEANTARQFQGSMADKDIAFKRELAATDQGNKLKEMDMAQQQFDLDKDTTGFNQRMAAAEAGRAAPKGPLDGIMGAISGGMNPTNMIGNALGPVKNIISNPIAAITGGGK